MCLQTTWKKPRKALKDIIVYKLLDENNTTYLSSPFNFFKYEVNKLYTTEMKITDDYSSFDYESQEARDKCDKCWVSIGEGFHSALKKDRIDGDENSYYRKVYKCIIPKGALYYKGLTDLIVSNKIKIIEKA